MRKQPSCWSVLGLVIVPEISAQSGNGSLRGKIVDEQGAAMPGATVTATSPQALTPVVAVTDGAGEYRLANLPPGTYTLKVELAGFSIVIREGILLRAAANFQVDELNEVGQLGGIHHRVRQVADGRGDQPDDDDEHRRRVPGSPAADRRRILDRLPADDAGRSVAAAQRRQRTAELYASGVEHREHVTQMDGFMAANYWDMNVNRTGLSGGDLGHQREAVRCRCASPDGIRPRHQHDLEERRQFPLGLGRPPSSRSHGTATTPLRTGRKRCRHAGHPESRSVRRVARRPDHEGQSGSSAPIAGRSSIPRWTARPPTFKPSRRSPRSRRQFPGEPAALISRSSR